MATDAGSSSGTRIVTVTDCGVDSSGGGLAGHIAVVFIVAAVSTAGFLLPAFSDAASSSKGGLDDHHHGHHHQKTKTRRQEVARALSAACQFGATAVLLNVGLVHTLGDATDHLSSPCLPAAFAGAFPDFAVLTTSATIMAMMLLDYAMLAAVERLAEADDKRTKAAVMGAGEAGTGTTATLETGVGGVIGRRASSNNNSNGVGVGIGLEPAMSSFGFDDPCFPPSSDTLSVAVAKATGAAACHTPLPAAPAGGGSDAYRRAVVALVEASACMHSVPVGLALGLQRGNGFVSLAIAISIHQCLEGFAVGAAVMEAPVRQEGRQGRRRSRSTVACYAAFFALTAPVGVAVGTGLRSVMNQRSPPFLLVVGFVNAVAAGMLVYVALRHVNAFDSQAAYLGSCRRRGGGEDGQDGGGGGGGGGAAPAWAAPLCLFSFVAFGAVIMAIGKWA